MIKVGITGQSGFVGTNLYNHLVNSDEYKIIPFEDNYYDDKTILDNFTLQCDVIVHLAAVMRNSEPGYVYNTNMRLVNEIINSAERTGSKTGFLFASSIQETGDSEYSRCKRDGAAVMEKWCKNNGTGFCKMVFPNLFGPFAKPNYSSFIATFCYKLIHGERPQIIVDNEIPLIYIGSLTEQIAGLIKTVNKKEIIPAFRFEPQYKIRVSEVLLILEKYKNCYINKGETPKMTSQIEKDLFITFCSYIDYEL